MTNMNQDLSKFILRLTLGVLLIMHGVAKLQNGITGIEGMLAKAGLPEMLAPLVYVGEVLAPLMIILGVFARPAALIVVVNMLFAIGLAHMGQLTEITRTGAWALETQAFFLFNAVALYFSGSGRYALKPSSDNCLYKPAVKQAS